MSNILFRWLIMIVLCLFVFSAEASEQAQEPAAIERPNIILINADDLGYADLGVTGSDLIATPNIDTMASEGVILTNFFASAPVCTPSRAGLLTGRYPVRSGLGLGVVHPGNRNGLPAEEITIAEALKPLGYRTAAIGKWHLGHYAEFWPTSQGFDYYFGLPYSNDMEPLPLYRGTEKIEEPADQTTLTKRYTEEAVQFIEESGDEPFFLYMPHTFPHIPLYASENFRGKSKAGIYGDTVEELDWSVGEIFSALERLGIDDKTLVLFTSDNGPWYEGATERRGRKQTSWEGDFHVPLIARWPRRIPAGIESDAMTMNIDIFPTLLELAGGEVPSDRVIDGRNIWPQLQGEKASPHEVLYFLNGGEIGAVRTAEWKLLLWPFSNMVPYIQGNLEPIVGPKLAAKAAASLKEMEHVGPFDNMDYWLLFDLEVDPQERYSLAENEPEALRYMQELLYKGRAEFEPLLKNNPPPSLGPGEPKPLENPSPPGMSVLGKAAIILLVLAGVVLIIIAALIKSRRDKK